MKIIFFLTAEYDTYFVNSLKKYIETDFELVYVYISFSVKHGFCFRLKR
jgi:hypothetical protein